MIRKYNLKPNEMRIKFNYKLILDYLKHSDSRHSICPHQNGYLIQLHRHCHQHPADPQLWLKSELTYNYQLLQLTYYTIKTWLWEPYWKKATDTRSSQNLPDTIFLKRIIHLPPLRFAASYLIKFTQSAGYVIDTSVNISVTVVLNYTSHKGRIPSLNRWRSVGVGRDDTLARWQ